MEETSCTQDIVKGVVGHHPDATKEEVEGDVAATCTRVWENTTKPENENSPNSPFHLHQTLNIQR